METTSQRHNTKIDGAEGPSNIVSYKDKYWFSYRRNGDLYVAYSSNMSKWASIKLAEKVGMSPKTSNRAQIVALDAIYVFWIDSSDRQVRAVKYGPDPKEPSRYKWFHAVTCRAPDGVAIKGQEGTSAALGAVASAGMMLVSLDTGKELGTFAFDPASWDAKWRATGGSSLKAADWAGHLEGFADFGTNQAMTLFSFGADSTFLLQMIRARNKAGSLQWLTAVRQLQNDPEEGSTDYWGPGSEPGSKPLLLWFDDATRVTTSLDPGGRVVVTYHDRNYKVWTRTLVASQVANAVRAWSGDPEDRPKAEKVWSDRRAVDVDFDVVTWPVTFFQLGDARSGAHPERKEVIERPVTRWELLAKGGGNTFTLGSDGGVVRKIFKAQTINLTEESSNRTVYVQGYIDSPPPVFDGMTDASADVNYAVTSTIARSQEVETNVTVGMKSEGSFSAFGVGVKWEASFDLTTGSAFGHERTKSISLDTILQLQHTPGGFANRGLARVSEIVVTRDAYEYIPAGAAGPVTDGPQCTSLYLDFQTGATKIEYTLGPDNVRVGDLESYEKDAWNARMAALPMYAGMGSYIENIVKPNAIGFQNGQSAVMDTWTPSSPISGSFESTSQTYQSSSMVLDQSVFTGVTASFFGFEASWMAGLRVSNRTTEKSVQTEGFGVSLKVDGTGGGDVARYRVQAYLLGANQWWLKELVALQPELGEEAQNRARYRIDQNGECWKIMYVVDMILKNHPITALGLDAARVAELSDRDIETTQDLLRSLGLEDPSELHGPVAADADPESADLLRALRAWDARCNFYAEET